MTRFIGLFVGSIIGYVIAYIQNKCENERRRRNNRFMDDKLKQALIQETERHIAQDILYDDVYVGPFTEKDGVDCAFHAVDWYRSNVWHPASQKPAGVDDVGRDVLIVTMGPEYYGNKLQTWHIFSYMTWEWVKAQAGEFEKWAYLADILPEKK